MLPLAGIQRADEPLLAETNDLSYRLVDRETPFRDLVIAHKTQSRVWAESDLNVVHPRDRLVELEDDGTNGAFAPRAVSVVGSITCDGALVDETVPRIHGEFERQHVDLLVLVPI